MRKITLSVLMSLGAVLVSNAQVNIVFGAPATSSLNGTSGNRGPNGTSGHTTMRAQYLVPASELAPIASNTAISSFGFNLVNGATGGSPAVGNFTVWLMNTSDATYTMGTTWNAASMTMAYSGTYSVPAVATATTVDLSFASNFNYTGNGLYVAYEYQGTTFATSPAVYSCYAPASPNQGATGATTVVAGAPAIATTLFRPQFRFGTPNPNSNDMDVQYVLPTGFIPANTYTSHTISAMVRNSSNTGLTNVSVGYSVTGVNPTSGVITIPSIAAGQTSLVNVPAYNVALNANGLNSVTFAVLPDQVNTNNMATATASLNCNKWGAGPTVTDFVNTAVGFNTGSGVIYTKFNLPATATLSGAMAAISSPTNNSNNGNASWAVLSNSLGASIATSNTITLTNAMNGTYQSYTFAPQVLTANTDYYLGIAQPSNAVGYFPIASSTVAVLPPSVYYTSALTATSVAVLNQNLGFLGIQAVLAGACGPVGINANSVADLNLSVYPNPAVSGKTNISGLEGVNTITVYNLLGQVVSTQKTDKEIVTIDLSNESVGTYMIKITNSDNRTKTVKVINQ